MLTATAHTLTALAIWRFLEGITTPGIFIITIAYVTEEWPATQVPRVMSAYVAGTVFGGFTGRFLGGILADHFGWNAVFVILGAIGVLGVAPVAKLLAPSKPRNKSHRAASVLKPIVTNLRNPRLLATFVIGFCMLFTLISTFNFVTFYLAGAPFDLTTSELSSLFAVYLIGLLATLGVGNILARIGLRSGMLLAVALGIAGIALTLIHSLAIVGLGLAAASSGVFIAQTCANSFIRDAAPLGGRVSAAGMYICSYYIGGTIGGMLPGLVWRAAGWPGCVALIAAILLLAGITTWFGWQHRRQPDPIPV
jgi:predicted MFS family arabinose efflux permease